MNQLVNSLLKPEAYSEKVEAVELIETAKSYLFLTGKHAYKVKKPVRQGFLDLMKPEDRRYYCHQEVEVNRRLSGGAYLGVVEVREHDGRFTVDGLGRAVDWAVKMLQLPREQNLSALIERDQVSDEDVRRLAARIAEFHDNAETSPKILRQGGVEAVRLNMEQIFSDIEKFVGVCLTRNMIDDLIAYGRGFLTARKNAFFQRALDGRIRDCHGDLNTGQVFMENGITVIGSVEVSDASRYSDVAEDVAGLAMDFDRQDRRDLAQAFSESYIQASEDAGLLELLDFFKTYRACVSGREVSERLKDPLLVGSERDKAVSVARDYFQLAHTYVTDTISRPAIFLIGGAAGTGKSTISRELAHRWELEYVSLEAVNMAPAGNPDGDHQTHTIDNGIYSPEISQGAYDAMLEQAGEHLNAGRSVVVDATFRWSHERMQAANLATRMAADLWFVECLLPQNKIRRRLDLPLPGRRRDIVSEARWKAFHRHRKEWEPVEEVVAGRYIRLETGSSAPETMGRLLVRLFASALQPRRELPIAR